VETVSKANAQQPAIQRPHSTIHWNASGHREIKLGQDTSRALKRAQPFLWIMVGAQNNMCPYEVVAEVLEACDHRKELPPSRTIISLWRLHNPGKESDWAFNPIHRGGECNAYSPNQLYTSWSTTYSSNKSWFYSEFI